MMNRRSIFAFSCLLPALAFACASSDNEADGTSTSSSTQSSSGGSTSTQSASGGSTSTLSASGGSTSSANGGGGAGQGGSAQGGSGTGGFSGDTVRLIAIGDTGEGNDDQHCLAWAMSAKCAQDGCDAVLLAGDNFYDEGVTDVNDAQWMDKFELPYDRPGLNGLPFYVVLGNHDYSPSPLNVILSHDGDKDAQIEYSSLPVGDGMTNGMRHSDKWTLPSAYYDVVFGNGMLHLFGTDGQDASDTQMNDMTQRVSASTARWKMAMMHFMRYTSGDHQDDMDFLNVVLGWSGPDLYEMQQSIYCGTDIFLAGHDHDREYITAGQDSACPNTHFLVSGAGAKNDTAEHTTMSHQAYFNNEIEGFFYLVFEHGQVTIESYDKVSMAGVRDEANCAPAGLVAPAYSATISKP